MSISTEKGDDGGTDLLYGRRVSKTHPRVVAGGAVDELNAALGLARVAAAVSADSDEGAKMDGRIDSIQKDLIQLMGEIALLEDDRERYLAGGAELIGGTAVDRLTSEVRRIEEEGELKFSGWALPGAGGSELAARLDMARTVCRRAEREVAALLESGELSNGELLRYLNRLSDLCWLWARGEEARSERRA